VGADAEMRVSPGHGDGVLRVHHLGDGHRWSAVHVEVDRALTHDPAQLDGSGP